MSTWWGTMLHTSARTLAVAAGLALADIVAPAFALAVTAIDIGQEAGLPARLPSMGESPVFDQDSDGDVDILLSTHGGEWPLLRQGPAGRFTRALAGTFADGQDRHGCTVGDFSRDG